MKSTIVFIEIGVWDNMATNHGAAVRLSKIKHSHSETTLVSHSFPTKNNKTNMFSGFLNVCLAFPACSAATLSCACAIWMFLWLHISYFLFFNFVKSECFFGFIFLISYFFILYNLNASLASYFLFSYFVLFWLHITYFFFIFYNLNAPLASYFLFLFLLWMVLF